MKRLGFILILLLAHFAKADCAGEGISFFPTSAMIAPNSIFVINAYGNSQKMIPGLGRKFKIYLLSDNDRINLLANEILVGSAGVTQAILKPETELSAGKTYRLVIENILPSETPKRKNAANELETFYYTISNNRDLSAPAVISDFKEVKKEFQMLGCGNSVNVFFNCPVNENGEFLVKATVKNLETGKVTAYYLEPLDNQIAVGRGMCGGAFSFGAKAEKHEVTFTVMDASGNMSQPSKAIRFTNPVFGNSKPKT